jgi:hypothetical protein
MKNPPMWLESAPKPVAVSEIARAPAPLAPPPDLFPEGEEVQEDSCPLNSSLP